MTFANMTPEQRAENLAKARAAREANKAAGIATTAKMTKTRAIKAKCKDCSGGSTQEVRICPVKKCPLWQFRCKNPESMDSARTECEETESDDDREIEEGSPYNGNDQEDCGE